MTRWGIALLTVGLMLFVSQARADDKEKLQGEWKLVSHEDGNGKKVDEDSPHKFTFEGDKWHSTPGGDGGPYSVDSSKKPKTIDLTLKDNNPRKGIYELDGDTLKICIGVERPTEFKSAEKVMVMTLKRVKK